MDSRTGLKASEEKKGEEDEAKEVLSPTEPEETDIDSEEEDKEEEDKEEHLNEEEDKEEEDKEEHLNEEEDKEEEDKEEEGKEEKDIVEPEKGEEDLDLEVAEGPAPMPSKEVDPNNPDQVDTLAMDFEQMAFDEMTVDSQWRVDKTYGRAPEPDDDVEKPQEKVKGTDASEETGIPHVENLVSDDEGKGTFKEIGKGKTHTHTRTMYLYYTIHFLTCA